MKMEYTKPVVEKEEFAIVDVVTTSPTDITETTTSPGNVDNTDGGED